MPIQDWTTEFSGLFHDFHHVWISEIKRALNRGILPPDYYALAEQVMGGPLPDVLALERTPRSPGRHKGNGKASATVQHNGGLLLAEAPPKVHHVAKGSDDAWFARYKKKSIVVRHRSAHQVVAVVEIVSRGNKSSKAALSAFVDKTVGFIRSKVHLLVIDLFPPSRRDPEGIHKAIWDQIEEEDFHLPRDKPLTLASYSASAIPQGFVEFVAVGDAFPDMPLFIQPEVYVNVPLDKTYQAAYAEVPDFWKEKLDATLKAKRPKRK